MIHFAHVSRRDENNSSKREAMGNEHSTNIVGAASFCKQNKTKSSEYYVHVYRQINVGIDKQNKTHIYTAVS